MISRILEQKKAIRVVLLADRKVSHLVLTWQDLDVLTAINTALAPLADFTDVMSGENYVTGSAILPIMDLLYNSVLQVKEEDKPLTNELRWKQTSNLETPVQKLFTFCKSVLLLTLGSRRSSLMMRCLKVWKKQCTMTECMSAGSAQQLFNLLQKLNLQRKENRHWEVFSRHVKMTRRHSPCISPEQKVHWRTKNWCWTGSTHMVEAVMWTIPCFDLYS